MDRAGADANGARDLAITRSARKACDFGASRLHVPRLRSSCTQQDAPGVASHLALAIRLGKGALTATLELRDDGRGVDREAVRRRAKTAGMPATTHQDLVNAMLSDGVSTRTEVTETSGRGVAPRAARSAGRSAWTAASVRRVLLFSTAWSIR